MNQCLINDGKWYNYPELYDIFSFSEDIDEKCIKIIKNLIYNNKIQIINPIDLGSGTGKIYDQLLSKISYEGHAYFIENNPAMLSFLEQKYKNNNKVKIVKNTIKSFKLNLQKSNFIISSFGFPSSLFDKDNTLEELKNVYKNLLDGGIFITIGWNEKWDDELSSLWKKYTINNFDKPIIDARNCGLSWLNDNIKTSLKFENIEKRDYVLNSLFGSCVKLDDRKLKLSMHMGITLNNKKELKEIIDKIDSLYKN